MNMNHLSMRQTRARALVLGAVAIAAAQCLLLPAAARNDAPIQSRSCHGGPGGPGERTCDDSVGAVSTRASAARVLAHWGRTWAEVRVERGWR